MVGMVISDKVLLTIPIKDNKEKLVNIKKVCTEIQIAIDPQSKRMQRLPENTCYMREGVARRLKKVQAALPKGYCLELRDGHRPLRIQKKIYDDYYIKLKKVHPDWPHEKVKGMTDTFVAPVEIVPPHSTGGAVDLTVVDVEGEELDMGTRVDAFTKKSYTRAKGISKKAQQNRAMLIRAMKQGGLVNYPPEWWHWSYGDRYWAATTKKRYSIYGGI